VVGAAEVTDTVEVIGDVKVADVLKDCADGDTGAKENGTTGAEVTGEAATAGAVKVSADGKAGTSESTGVDVTGAGNDEITSGTFSTD
jgi:hypothetical protein